MRVAALAAAVLVATAAFADEPPAGMLPAPFPGGIPDQALIDADAPSVTLRTDEASGDTVEEHRHDGMLLLVRVRPASGTDYLLLDNDGDGRLDTLEGELPAQAPAYWSFYDWE